MDESLNIMIVAAECVPYAKTGGLGDVVGSLPLFLNNEGFDIRVVIPAYSLIDRNKYNIHQIIQNMSVQMGGEQILCNVLETQLNGEIPVYLIDYEPFFGRFDIYHDADFNDYADNPKRYTLLSKAALELCHALNFSPDIIHANDWHTAIIPAYLKRLYMGDTLFKKTASVLTIHNIAYQGRYPGYFFPFTGLGWEDFTEDKFECYHDINLMKGGIYFADMVNTVSKGYAGETKTQLGGYGLQEYLIRKGENYVGILNGVDYSQWDPEKDILIPANYTPKNMKGKFVCKKKLQNQLGLNEDAITPVIGIVSRFVDQKGLYLLAECIEGILQNFDVQFAILGAGDKQLEAFYGNLKNRYPGKAGSYIGYSNELAHLIEAGSDFFLMPSIYEPCGLNQIYSLKYGTIPIVRATGGLNDTIENYNQATGEGNGFKFFEPSGKAIYDIVKLALGTYYCRKNHIKKLIRNAMAQHYSWDNSVKEYVALYRKALTNSKH
jgi:starch synthase